MFMYFLLFGFLLVNQPFQMVMLVIFITIVLLQNLHLTIFLHWTNYMIFMVYLGGLLILFLYFTSIISNYSNIYLYVSFLGMWGLQYMFEGTMKLNKEISLSKETISGVFVFSFYENCWILFCIFLMLFNLLVLLSFFASLSAPMRQN